MYLIYFKDLHTTKKSLIFRILKDNLLVNENRLVIVIKTIYIIPERRYLDISQDGKSQFQLYMMGHDSHEVLTYLRYISHAHPNVCPPVYPSGHGDSKFIEPAICFSHPPKTELRNITGDATGLIATLLVYFIALDLELFPLQDVPKINFINFSAFPSGMRAK